MDKYPLQDVKTGEVVELPVDYQVILDTPANGIIKIRGQEYRKAIKIRSPEAPKVQKWAVTNRKTFAAGVHRDQVPEAREFVKTVHPGLEVADNGDILCGSRAARAAWLKSQKLKDRDGGYSD